MKKLFTLLLIFIAGTLLHKPAMAQSYPVQATVVLTPPYSVYLADYTSPGSNRIMVNVLLKDLTRFDLQARLKLTIEGVGVSITTKPTYRPQPLYLQGGLPLMLTEADLAPYFNPDNLVFQGVSRNSILRGGALPEGLYRICIEVLDYNVGARVSNLGCASAWLVLNDPPIINLPFQGEKVRAQYPQNVVFQWTPRHTGSPNAAFSTEYEFELVELWQPNINPNHAMLSSPPIYQTTTFSTTLIYGPAEPPLEPGRKYAFRVKARAMAGIDQLDLFKNKGYSEVFTFTYGDACTTPSFISATSISSSRVHVSWHAEPVHSEFIVGYRKQGDGQWQEQSTYLTELIISELQPETVYEFRVRGVCGFVEGEDTEAVMSMTSEAPVTNFVCGAGPDAYSLDNQKPLPELKPGDIFRTTDIEVRVFDVQGGNGTFSGTGHVRVPWMKQVSLRVEFNSIFINSDYQMLRGVVKTIFNPHSQAVVNLDSNDELSGDENNGDEASQDADVEITYDGEISDVQVNTETGEIIVTDEDGNQTTYEQETEEETGEKKSVKIIDSSGDVFLIDKDGNVTKGTANDGNSTPDEGSQQQFTIEEKIIIAVLEDFKTRMEAWLEVHGKGPLSDYEMMWAEGLPGCLPEEPETVEGAQEYVTYLLEDKENRIPELTGKMKDSPEWKTITGIGENISDASEMTAENMDNAGEAVCPYIFDEAINSANCPRCPKPDYVGTEGEEVVTFESNPIDIKRGRGAKRWFYFAGYSQSEYYSAPDNIEETAAGWYTWDDYIKHVELVIESVAIASGDVALHPSNADDIIEYRERILEVFNSGREVSDNFKKLIAKEYSRVSKEAFNKYSGSGYLEPVYPIYEVLGLFSGKQLIKALVRFGKAFRVLKGARHLINYKYSGNVLKIFSKQGDEIAYVIDGQIKPLKFLDEGEEIAEISGQKLLKQGDEVGFKTIADLVNSLDEFLKLPLAKKLENIKKAWEASYPQIFFERKLFEDIMGHYRYPKSSGWGHTSDIASNFKAIDFYEDFTKVGDEIFAAKAVSMKTTTTKSVDVWLNTKAVQDNLENLAKGLDEGVTWSGKNIRYTNAEIHIYMPKENITSSLKADWIGKIGKVKPELKVEIYSLEDFVK